MTIAYPIGCYQVLSLSAVEALYEQLTIADIETQYDDRPERAGMKFNDAKLLGMPLRLTIGDGRWSVGRWN